MTDKGRPRNRRWLEETTETPQPSAVWGPALDAGPGGRLQGQTGRADGLWSTWRRCPMLLSQAGALVMRGVDTGEAGSRVPALRRLGHSPKLSQNKGVSK